MFKALVIFCAALGFTLDVLREWLDARWQRTPIPESVRDVYDAQEYARWQRYSREKKRLSLLGSAVSTAVLIAVFATDALAWVCELLPQGEYPQALLLFVVWMLFSSLIEIPFHYIDQMKIEEKYGFNRSTMATFVLDEIKGFIISTGLFCALLAVSIACWHTMGGAFFLAVYAALALFMLVFSTCSLTFMKLFNKFTPLEEGSLRERLETMFAQNGYRLKNIYVMNASKRTAKANAFCAGLGKFKEIALYDTMIESFTEDEIVAVFAHELTHFKHSDTRVLTVLNVLRFLPAMLLIWLLATQPALLAQMGFDRLNFGMVFIVLFSALLSPVMTVMQLPFCAISCRMERRADAYPASIGLGEAMVSALKKTARLNFSNLNPHPLNVKLFYSHPPIAERIRRIQEAEKAK